MGSEAQCTCHRLHLRIGQVEQFRTSVATILFVLSLGPGGLGRPEDLQRRAHHPEKGRREERRWQKWHEQHQQQRMRRVQGMAQESREKNILIQYNDDDNENSSDRDMSAVGRGIPFRGWTAAGAENRSPGKRTVGKCKVTNNPKEHKVGAKPLGPPDAASL